jgi:hypothetical protein
MISSDQLRSLHRLLVDSFDEDELHALYDRLGVPVEQIVPGGDLSGRLFEVIKLAERAGWVPDLVRAARQAHPQNETLAVLAADLGLEPQFRIQPAGDTTAERSASPTAAGGTAQPPVDLTDWPLRIPEIAARVCRVEVGGAALARAFSSGRTWSSPPAGSWTGPAAPHRPPSAADSITGSWPPGPPRACWSPCGRPPRWPPPARGPLTVRDVPCWD